ARLQLVAFLARTDRRAEAEKEAEAAVPQVDAAERKLFAAAAHAAFGRVERATEAFKAARQERPADLTVLRAEADFLYRTGQLDAAAEAFERLAAAPTATPTDKEVAREMAVLCLASDRDYEKSRTALIKLGLLDEKGQLRPRDGSETPVQRRSRTLALALQRDRESRLEAIRLFETDDRKTPGDRFILAQLYALVGRPDDARETMRALAQENDRAIPFVRAYALMLLRSPKPEAAKEWVDKLAALQPDALATAEVQSRLARATGQPDREVRKPLTAHEKGPDAPLLGLARVYELVKLYDDAERMYTRLAAEMADKQPQAPLGLIGFHGRRGNTAKALELCDQFRRKTPGEVVAVAQAAVEQVLYTTPNPRPADVKAVVAWIEEAAQKATDPNARGRLTQLLGSARNLLADYDSTIDLYRKAADANPRDVLALNNLAFLLSAHKGDHRQALEKLAAARKVAGPLPDLLDTEALVRMKLGGPDELQKAAELLRVVTKDAPSGAAFFHLAQAELAMAELEREPKLKRNRRDAAEKAWQEAEQLGVKATDLHPLERKDFERVSDALK
ncbi:MAG: tetratricopeptide repeat protein, partial [Gemmataceae bacterium]|nr:tetratricopeptide repeat protein [Gemmataceae bacterium]